MCEFISWKRSFQNGVLFLTDKEVFSSFGRKQLKGTRNNDVLGHGAIDAYHGLRTTIGARSFEYEKFWHKSKYPPEIAKFLKSPKTVIATWGQMLNKSLEPWKAYDILRVAPVAWRRGLANFLIQIILKDARYSFYTLRNIKTLQKKERAILIDRTLEGGDPDHCYWILWHIKNLTKKKRVSLIKVISKSSSTSYYVLFERKIKDITKEERIIFIKGISRSQYYSHMALIYIKNLSQEERKILKKASNKYKSFYTHW